MALRGYSSERGKGGLIGRLLDLVDDLEAAVGDWPSPDDDETSGPLVGYSDEDEDEPGYLAVLREGLASLGGFEEG